MRSADLMEELNAVDESTRIEAKRASELGKSVVGAEAEACNRELTTLLGKDCDYLRNEHLSPMVRDGQLRFRYLESAKHLHPAYVA